MELMHRQQAPLNMSGAAPIPPRNSMRDRSRPLLERIAKVFALALWSAGLQADDLGAPPRAEYPGTASVAPLASITGTVDLQDRAAVVDFFQSFYRASEGVPTGWDGETAACIPGTNSTAYLEATVQRVNFFRAMARLPATVVLREDWNRGCQAAAIMMSAERQLSHTPAATWRCYSKEGAEAASRSNLYLGRAGPEAIDGYMDDHGANNYFAGHRRWILYPPLNVAGAGSVLAQVGGGPAVNCLWVIGGSGSRPQHPEWIAWPPPGYVPYQVIPRASQRWSFSYRSADFSAAKVEMRHAGTNMPVRIEPLQNDRGYGDNTIVWIPTGVPFSPPEEDISYTVSISNVKVTGTSRSFEYDVILIDPDQAPPDRAPQILEHPGNMTVTANSPAIFRVIAEGPGPLSFQWRFHGVDISGANRSSLTIANSTLLDAGDYDVVVSNDAGSVTSRSARLNVLAAPVIETEPSERLAFAGDNVIFEVIATGSPPLSYAWQFNDAPIPGASNPALLLSNVQAEQSGFYDVIVSNPVGTARSTPALLTVTVPEILRFTSIELDQGLIRIWWEGTGFLQQAGSLNGPWVTLPEATSPYASPVNSSIVFYRLGR
jgi:hypothetical protein